MKRDGDDLSPQVRAEDILLGSLGYGEEASIITVEKTTIGYRGIGKWPDGEQFSFECDEELDSLQAWALAYMTAR
jgi:hypothetical protein